MPDLQAFKNSRIVIRRVLPQCSDQNLSICLFCGPNVWVVGEIPETNDGSSNVKKN